MQTTTKLQDNFHQRFSIICLWHFHCPENRESTVLTSSSFNFLLLKVGTEARHISGNHRFAINQSTSIVMLQGLAPNGQPCDWSARLTPRVTVERQNFLIPMPETLRQADVMELRRCQTKTFFDAKRLRRRFGALGGKTGERERFCDVRLLAMVKISRPPNQFMEKRVTVICQRPFCLSGMFNLGTRNGSCTLSKHPLLPCLFERRDSLWIRAAILNDKAIAGRRGREEEQNRERSAEEDSVYSE